MTPPKTVVFWKGVNGSSKTRMTDAAERRNGRSVNSMKAFELCPKVGDGLK